MKKLCPRCGIPLVGADGTQAICPKCYWSGHYSQGLREPSIAKMALPYVSIDLETTGLDPATCQILEFGAVYDDWTKPLSELPTFRRLIAWDQIVGEPFALQMNAKLLQQIAQRQQGDPLFCDISELRSHFANWLVECGWIIDRITPAGKNFASFDRNFLVPLGMTKRLLHRTLDPAPMYWQPTDSKLPDLATCLSRAGLDGEVTHTAVEDAMAVVKVIRAAAKRVKTW